MSNYKYLTLFTAFAFVFLAVFATEDSFASKENLLSVPAQKNTPVLNVYCDFRLAPIVESVSGRLRKRSALDVHIHVGDSTSLIKLLAKDPTKADLLLLEGREAMYLLVKNKLVLSKNIKALASTSVVIAIPANTPNEDPIKLIKKAKPGRITVADPHKTTAGFHSYEALKRIGIYKESAFRFRFLNSAKEALDELDKDKADAALAYKVDVIQRKSASLGMAFPKKAHLPIVYYGVPLKNAKNLVNAESFILFLMSNLAKEDWEKAGFDPPPKPDEE